MSKTDMVIKAIGFTLKVVAIIVVGTAELGIKVLGSSAKLAVEHGPGAGRFVGQVIGSMAASLERGFR